MGRYFTIMWRLLAVLVAGTMLGESGCSIASGVFDTIGLAFDIVDVWT